MYGVLLPLPPVFDLDAEDDCLCVVVTESIYRPYLRSNKRLTHQPGLHRTKVVQLWTRGGIDICCTLSPRFPARDANLP